MVSSIQYVKSPMENINSAEPFSLYAETTTDNTTSTHDVCEYNFDFKLAPFMFPFIPDRELPSFKSFISLIDVDKVPSLSYIQATKLDVTKNSSPCVVSEKWIARQANFSLYNPSMMKRPRRRYHEVNRPYRCNYKECNLGYGALNHLNAHIKNMNHGPRRRAKEFPKKPSDLSPSQQPWRS